MSVWSVYHDRISSRGLTKREALLRRESATLLRKLPDSLSYQNALLFSCDNGFNIDGLHSNDGEQRNVAIINSDNLNEKTIIALPGEDIEHGSLVYWMDNYWLVTERDANTTIYTRAKMIQCNYLLKWIGTDDNIYEQWCIIEDGTKYLTGDYEDRNFVVTRGDSRIAMTIARNSQTMLFNRTNRFIIDDYGSTDPIAYELTKPLKVGSHYNGAGVYKFVLREAVTTDDDNLDLRIADYYKHFLKEGSAPPDGYIDNGKKVWI